MAQNQNTLGNNPLVAICMGSHSDWPTMKEAAEKLKHFDIPYFTQVVSAHRTPFSMIEFGKECEKKGVKIIIAGAGGAAHLPGMIASSTRLPVIGIPINSSNSIAGIDSLLSIAQMPNGIPVATMAVDGAANGGILAARILGLTYPELQARLQSFQQELQDKVKKQQEELDQDALSKL